MMHTYIDRWLQHLHHVHSYERQVSYGDSSQVCSQSQCRQHCPEEWLQFPGQSMPEIGQWHLGRQIHWIMFHRNMSRHLKCKPTKSAIWGRLDIIFWLNSTLLLYSNSMTQIQWACTYSCIPSDENPSCLHATLASDVSQKLSHTVPHALLLQISTRPSEQFVPPRSLMSPLVHVAEYIERYHYVTKK